MAHDHTLSPEEAKKARIRGIWKVAGILGFVTAIEFVFALNWPDGVNRTPLNILFIALTLVKAFYIVAEFMHLRHEVKVLILSIVLPCVFVLWLILALLMEGTAIFGAYNSIWG